jgi:similar to spore coat protein
MRSNGCVGGVGVRNPRSCLLARLRALPAYRQKKPRRAYHFADAKCSFGNDTGISKGAINLATQYMGVHETLEVHELMMFKTLCLTKSSTMSGLAQDDKLKNLLSKDINKTVEQINQLQQFITDRGAKS